MADQANGAGAEQAGNPDDKKAQDATDQAAKSDKTEVLEEAQREAAQEREDNRGYQ